MKLSEKFINKYKNKKSPMTPLGKFVYYRTYSRYLPEENRREYWYETCKRAVEYNCSIVETSQKEAEELFDNMFNLKQFLAGRTLWVGNTESVKKFPISNYNCSFSVIDSIESYCDMFYLLMLGSGVGFSTFKEDTDKLPTFKHNIVVTHKPYEPKLKSERCEDTVLTNENKHFAELIIGDSKEGWVEALRIFMDIFSIKLNPLERRYNFSQLIINYNNVRPRGERLKTFGGTASGYLSLMNMFNKIYQIFRNKKEDRFKLTTLDCLDIANIIAENVVSGGVRRSSLLNMFDVNDKDVRDAKNKLFIQDENGNWIIDSSISHRSKSNNSIGFKKKPTLDELKDIFKSIKYSGEPGFLNMEEATNRFEFFKGANPCCEILLPSKGLCNLVTVNINGFVKKGKLDKNELFKAFKLNARAAYRITCLNLELKDWDKVQKEHRLLGCSLTGWQDAISVLNYDMDKQSKLLSELKDIVKNEVKEYSQSLGLMESKLSTACKPEGCWTKDHIRTLNEGLLFIDEINPSIDTVEGFSKIKGFTCGGNKVSKTYNNSIKDVLRITLKNKRRLEITQEHPLFIKGEGWVKAKNIKIGDIIEYNLGTYVSVNEETLEDVTMEEFRSDIRNYNTPLRISPELSYLVGTYFANGCFTTKDRIKLHCQNFDIHKKIQKIWKDLFNVNTKIYKCKDRDSYTQDFRSSKITKWFWYNNLIKENKSSELNRIPQKIRMSSKESILSFIVGYADNDGCFYNNTFCIDSSSEVFIRHLQEIGEAVGICFGFCENKMRKGSFSNKSIYKIQMSRAFSNMDTIDYINRISIKAQNKPLRGGKIRSENPYVVKNIENIGLHRTYDIEVDNIHEYFQGGLRSHNTLSLLPTVSPGIHHSFSSYYIRRIRISSDDPLLKVCEELGFSIKNEVGQSDNDYNTKVVEFYVKSPTKIVQKDVSALEQLETYKMFMENYVEHNASNTITVKEHEWNDVIDWVYKNWDYIVGVTFMSANDSYYPLLPYEAITEEEYNKNYKDINITSELISKYENNYNDYDIDNDSECSGGSCPIR